MRNEIHEKLNAFDERKKKYEQEQEERRKMLHEQSRSLPFPFFVPPPSERDNNRRHPRNERFRDDEKKHNDEFEDFLRGWQEVFDGEDMERHRENNRRKREEQQQQQSIEELHREMQSMFEAAFAGGMMPPHGKGQNGTQSRGGSWSSSSSTTFVSNSNGTSYTMKQDSKNGARVDLKLPKNCESENVSLEVLKDRPCLIRWKNHNENETSNGQHPSSRHRKARTNPSGGQVFELGDSVDCSRLSASISEAQRTLTVEAPPRGRNGASIEDDQQQQHLSLKPNSYPRPVRVTKKQ